MTDLIEPVTGIKKKKNVFAPQISFPVPFIIWSGSILPTHFAKMIFEGGHRVSEAAMTKTREVREDHDRETHKRHTERFWKAFCMLSMQSNDLNRDFVIIPSA